MRTPTYTYRIYHYTNGLGESIWRAKRKGLFGLFYWISADWILDEVVLSFTSRDRLVEYLQHDADKRRAKLSDRQKAKLSDKLTLVVIEEDIAL